MQPDLHTLAKDFTEGKLTHEEFLYRRAKMICAIVSSNDADFNGDISAIEEYESKHLIPKLAKENQIDEDNSKRMHQYAKIALFVISSIFAIAVVLNFVLGSIEEIQSPPIEISRTQPQSTNTQIVNKNLAAPSLESQIITMLNNDDWDTEQLLQFLHTWEKSPKLERRSAVNSTGFSSFEDELFNRIYQNADTEIGDELADIQILTAIANELSRFPRNSVTKKKNLASNTTRNRDSSTSSKNIQKTSLSKQKPAKQTTPAKPKQNIVPATVEDIGITGTDINYAMTRYKKAFEAGDINSLARLFDDKATTNSGDNKTLTMQKYSELIAGTNDRNMRFAEWNWKNQGNFASGYSQVKVSMNNMVSGKIDKLSADIFVNLSKRNNEVVISKMRWDNIQYGQESTTANANGFMPQPATSKSSETVELPSDEELKNMLSIFIDSYEIGDAESFSALFAENAMTNDHNSRQSILEDYAELFSKTADRKMFIRNLDWTYRNNKAVGKGHVEVLVRPNKQTNKRKLIGKIEIVTEKRQNKVYISRLYHSLQ